MSALLPASEQVASICRQAAYAAVFVTFLGLAGCASDSYSSPAQSTAPKVVAEVEADGLPAQTPPPSRVRLAPDDPSEPFSRNYGGVNPSAVPALTEHDSGQAPLHAEQPQIPADLPMDFRRKLVQAMAENE